MPTSTLYALLMENLAYRGIARSSPDNVKYMSAGKTLTLAQTMQGKTPQLDTMASSPVPFPPSPSTRLDSLSGFNRQLRRMSCSSDHGDPAQVLDEPCQPSTPVMQIPSRPLADACKAKSGQALAPSSPGWQVKPAHAHILPAITHIMLTSGHGQISF